MTHPQAGCYLLHDNLAILKKFLYLYIKIIYVPKWSSELQPI